MPQNPRPFSSRACRTTTCQEGIVRRIGKRRRRYRSSQHMSDCYTASRKSGILTFRSSPADFMNATGKIQNKGQVTIPTAVRRQAGLTKGDLVNFAFQRGKIVMTPKLVIDRSEFPHADD